MSPRFPPLQECKDEASSVVVVQTRNLRVGQPANKKAAPGEAQQQPALRNVGAKYNSAKKTGRPTSGRPLRSNSHA